MKRVSSKIFHLVVDGNRTLALSAAVLTALLIAVPSKAQSVTLDAPTLSVLAVEDRQVVLEWTMVKDALSFQYRKSSDGGASWGNWQKVDSVITSFRQHRARDLKNGTTYAFQVRAFALVEVHFKEVYSAPSNTVLATPTAQ